MKAHTRRRRYRREAAPMLLAARIALRFVPPARLIAWAGRPPRRHTRFRRDEIGWVAWAVDEAGRRSGPRAPALACALAGQIMLRRRGIAASLCLGVARENGQLVPQAWLEVAGEVVLGAPGAARAVRMFGTQGAATRS
jgi:hypothetical protein